MAKRVPDLYDFENDDYVESQTPGLSESFMDMLREDSSEDDFCGFTSEEAIAYGRRPVNKFHTATNPATGKENVNPDTKRPRKRKSDPSR